MKKKLIIVGLTCLTVGGILGGIIGALGTTRMFASGMLLIKRCEVYKAQDQAWQAYISDKPQIAEWELTQAISSITDARTSGYPDTNELNQLEFEAEARLALVNKKAGAEAVYEQHMTKAKLLAQLLPVKVSSSLQTSEQITDFIGKMDTKQRKQND